MHMKQTKNKIKVYSYLTPKQFKLVEKVMEQREITMPEAIRRIFDDYLDVLEKQDQND